MATVIVIGLSIGTLFTLFVQPAVYAIFVDLGMKLTFRKQTSKRSGMMSENAPNTRQREN